MSRFPLPKAGANISFGSYPYLPPSLSVALIGLGTQAPRWPEPHFISPLPATVVRVCMYGVH